MKKEKGSYLRNEGESQANLDVRGSQKTQLDWEGDKLDKH